MSDQAGASGEGIAPLRVEVTGGGDGVRIEIPGYAGPLSGLVAAVQRGDVEAADLPLAGITAAFRRSLGSVPGGARPQAIADFLTLAGRLVGLKAQALLPDRLDEQGDDEDEVGGPAESPGRRLEEYRLFRAAADALLSESSEEGARSFLGLAAPHVEHVERLTIAPERLAAAFREVLRRIADTEPVALGTATFSVAGMVERLRDRLARRSPLPFEEVFAGCSSRLEAVALFLALLQLLSDGGAGVEQRESFGPIMVVARGRGQGARR